MSDEPVQVTLRKQDLQDVFDIAVGSLDFGSGFLDKDEVVALRAVARVLGVEPDRGTPSNVHMYFAHAYEASATVPGVCGARNEYRPPECGRPADDPVHNGVSFDDPAP